MPDRPNKPQPPGAASSRPEPPAPSSPQPGMRRPLNERLADRTPRDLPPDGMRRVAETPMALRTHTAEEAEAVVIGCLVLRKVAEFGQTRADSASIESVIQAATERIGAKEMMDLEVEAYEILDWLVGGELLSAQAQGDAARRHGDVVRYDPSTPIATLLQRAIAEEFDVKIDYFSRSRGEMNTRRITPMSIDAETYTRAYCHARQAERVFRINRITRCIPINGRPYRRELGGASTKPPAEPAQLDLGLGADENDRGD